LKREVGSGKWEDGSGKMKVGSGKWEVKSGKIGVGSWKMGKARPDASHFWHNIKLMIIG